MKIPLVYLRVWFLIKIEIIRIFNFIKSNDVTKLMVILACITSCSSVNSLTRSFDLQMCIGFITTLLSVFCMIYLFSSFYYLSFRIKKTEYTLPRILYFFVVVICILNFLMKFCTVTYIPAIIGFQIVYAIALLHLAIELRKVLIQQYINVKNSVFSKVTEDTGLIVIASTHYGIFGKFTGTPNNYMLGFNKNIKTWFVLGVFLKMNKQGVYLKKVFMTYNEVVMFNNTFDKKIIDYTRSELDTAIMYSI
jgi:hypothetical protein